MIDMPAIEQKFNMKRIRAYVDERHKAKIWFAENDKRWKTYYDKKVIAKKDENSLYDALYDLYKTAEDNKSKNPERTDITFKAMFEEYKEYKKALVHDNTIYKYEKDYARFYSGTDFEMMNVTDITEEDINTLLATIVKSKKLRKKAYEALFDYTRATLRYCKNKRIIKDNPSDYIDRKYFYKFCYTPPVNPKDRVVSENELKAIQAKIHSDRAIRDRYIVDYAVELAPHVGMRVGELAVLRWDHIDFAENYIVVDMAEVYNVKTREYEISKTKNSSTRIVPLTEKAKIILTELKKVQMKYGYLCEWVFANEDGRIHKIAIGQSAQRKSSIVCGKPKSIHAHRRTMNSKLKSSGVPTTVAASILGHTEEVNETHYTYDVTDVSYKKGLMEAVGV